MITCTRFTLASHSLLILVAVVSATGFATTSFHVMNDFFFFFCTTHSVVFTNQASSSISSHVPFFFPVLTVYIPASLISDRTF